MIWCVFFLYNNALAQSIFLFLSIYHFSLLLRMCTAQSSFVALVCFCLATVVPLLCSNGKKKLSHCKSKRWLEKKGFVFSTTLFCSFLFLCEQSAGAFFTALYWDKGRHKNLRSPFFFMGCSSNSVESLRSFYTLKTLATASVYVFVCVS